MSFPEIKVEPWSAITAEDRKLCQRHWEEIAHNKEKIKLDPDWERYDEMGKRGVLHLTTARRDGVLVGYVIYFLVYHVHYRKSLTAIADVLYLVPEERFGRTGIRLLEQSEASLKGMGVQRVVQNVKVDHDWSPILTRLGYKPFERLFSKLLG